MKGMNFKMIDTIHVLNVPISNINREKAKKNILTWLYEEKSRMVFTPNSEMVMAAQEDEKLKTVLGAADMVIPDGIGVVWASKYSEQKLEERVAGCDLAQELLKELAGTDRTVYLLGGAPGVADKAAKNMCAKHQGLKIIGAQHGYFKQEEERIIIENIKALKPDLLLVALSVPRQEKWIYDHKDELGVKVAMGVGGTVDIMAGTVKRAPLVFQKLGLEWLHRLIKQPTRIVRMMQLPIFAITVIKKAKF
jgi:N-acetylglucosaminyldiphosphoundecaprenol N-acetyl-beta-D-mannosaminyltransferase